MIAFLLLAAAWALPESGGTVGVSARVGAPGMRWRVRPRVALARLAREARARARALGGHLTSDLTICGPKRRCWKRLPRRRRIRE
eukprot:3341066-Pyramimonas_sp.AAC.1